MIVADFRKIKKNLAFRLNNSKIMGYFWAFIFF